MRRSRALVIAGALALAAAAGACSSDDGGSAAPDVELSAAGERGEQVAKQQGCTSCHTTDGSSANAPTWLDLAGSEVELDDGTTVVADDDYLRTSIICSKTQVVDGYLDNMPIYEGEISAAELEDLLAYLHDLSSLEVPAPEATTATTSLAESGC